MLILLSVFVYWCVCLCIHPLPRWFGAVEQCHGHEYGVNSDWEGVIFYVSHQFLPPLNGVSRVIQLSSKDTSYSHLQHLPHPPRPGSHLPLTASPLCHHPTSCIFCLFNCTCLQIHFCAVISWENHPKVLMSRYLLSLWRHGVWEGDPDPSHHRGGIRCLRPDDGGNRDGLLAVFPCPHLQQHSQRHPGWPPQQG